jgi:hypothetical protein
MAENPLRIAESRVLVGESHIARQRYLLTWLEQANRGKSESARVARDVMATLEKIQAIYVADRDRLKRSLNQNDEGDLLRDEVSDEALEAAASVATGALPTLWYSTHCFGCPSRPASAVKLLSEDEARRIAANVVKLPRD